MRCPKVKIENENSVVFERLHESILSIRSTLLKTKHTCCLNKNDGLLMAALTGDHKAIKGLGECPKADINTVDAKGRTPLYLASLFGHAKATEVNLTAFSISCIWHWQLSCISDLGNLHCTSYVYYYRMKQICIYT